MEQKKSGKFVFCTNYGLPLAFHILSSKKRQKIHSQSGDNLIVYPSEFSFLEMSNMPFYQKTQFIRILDEKQIVLSCYLLL